MRSGTITIAQVSDVHLAPVPPIPRALLNVKRATGYLNWRRIRIDVHSRVITDRLVSDLKARGFDHLAITGDLINLGLPDEMAAAARWLETVGTPDRVAVIPGNHDIYSDIGRDRGLERWAPYMAGATLGDTAFPYVRRIGHVALIGLNSAIPTAPLKAIGVIGSAQRERLAQLLDGLAGEGLVRVVMIHHPPLPNLAPPAKELTDAAALEAVLLRHGAELVIHGHNHRFMRNAVRRPEGRTIPVIGVPSVSARRRHGADDLAAAHLYHIGRDGTIRLERRGLSQPDAAVESLGDLALA
jgi:3',5'-cyclic AMP phosphodiesterase CpdA